MSYLHGIPDDDALKWNTSVLASLSKKELNRRLAVIRRARAKLDVLHLTIEQRLATGQAKRIFKPKPCWTRCAEVYLALKRRPEHRTAKLTLARAHAIAVREEMDGIPAKPAAFRTYCHQFWRWQDLHGKR